MPLPNNPEFNAILLAWLESADDLADAFSDPESPHDYYVLDYLNADREHLRDALISGNSTLLKSRGSILSKDEWELDQRLKEKL